MKKKIACHRTKIVIVIFHIHSTDNCINKNLNRIKSTKTPTYFMNSNNDMTWTKNIILFRFI